MQGPDLVINLDLDLRRVCLDHEHNIEVNLEGQVEQISPHLNIWFQYEDVKLVFRAKSGAEYSAVVLKAANGGEAHKSARSIEKFLQQKLTAADGKGRDLTVHGILGITATGDQLKSARSRIFSKHRSKLRILQRQQDGVTVRKSSGNKREAKAAAAEAIEVGGAIAQLQQQLLLLEGQQQGHGQDAEDDELVVQPQVCILTFARSIFCWSRHF